MVFKVSLGNILGIKNFLAGATAKMRSPIQPVWPEIKLSTPEAQAQLEQLRNELIEILQREKSVRKLPKWATAKEIEKRVPGLMLTDEKGRAHVDCPKEEAIKSLEEFRKHKIEDKMTALFFEYYKKASPEDTAAENITEHAKKFTELQRKAVTAVLYKNLPHEVQMNYMHTQR